MVTITNFKYRKHHRYLLSHYHCHQKSQKSQQKTFEHFSYITMQSRVLVFEEYEAVRRILSRKLFRLLRFSIRSHPSVMVTAKPKEMRMGKGKGSFQCFTIATVAGQWFAKTSWCHREKMPTVLFAARTAVKKSAQLFHL